MSIAYQFACDHCARRLEAWDDGNPYFLDEDGEKQYAYHPDHDRLERCIGNDSPHLCLACGTEFMVDSRSPTDRCPSCAAADIVDTVAVDGCRCPWCKVGHLAQVPGFFAIS